MKLPPESWWYHAEALHKYGVDAQTRTIFVAPENVGGDVDESMADKFLKNLALLEGRGEEPITVCMMTCGGSWDYGMAMFDAIQFSPCYITTVSYAHARSMSSIIPQAADWRIIMPNCYWMMHWGTDGYEGVAHGLPSYAEMGHAAGIRMLDIYYSRCKDGEYFKGWREPQVTHFLRDKMNQKVDWYLSAAESVEHGFMDEVAYTARYAG